MDILVSADGLCLESGEQHLLLGQNVEVILRAAAQTHLMQRTLVVLPVAPHHGTRPETCDVIFSNTRLYYSKQMTMSHNTMRPYACQLRIREMYRTDN